MASSNAQVNQQLDISLNYAASLAATIAIDLVILKVNLGIVNLDRLVSRLKLEKPQNSNSMDSIISGVNILIVVVVIYLVYRGRKARPKTVSASTRKQKLVVLLNVYFSMKKIERMLCLFFYHMTPPPQLMSWPVMLAASSEAKKSAKFAASSGPLPLSI